MYSPPTVDRQRAFLELRRRRGVEHLHPLGTRALDEYLAELGRAHGIEADIVERLDRWRNRLTREMVYVAGGDRFPPPFAVLRGRRQ